MPGTVRPLPPGLLEKALDRRRGCDGTRSASGRTRHVTRFAEQVTDLRGRIGVRIGPAAEREPRHALADLLAQLPGVLDAPRAPTLLSPPSTTSASNPCACARSAYARQYSSGCLHVRNGTTPERGHIGAEIDDEVAEVVFLLDPTALSVRNTKRALPGEAVHGVIGVDPRVHARAGLRVRRAAAAAPRP